jgi:hypothetical protein
MVMNKRSFFVSVGVLLLLALAAPAVMANCIPAKLAGQSPGQGFGYRGYVYFVPYLSPYGESSPLGGYPVGWTNDADLHAGKFWQPGNRAGANEGAMVIDDWLKGSPQSYYKHWVGINLGDGNVMGCPSTALVYIIEDQIDDDDNDPNSIGDGFAENARFVVSRAPEISGPAYDFDMNITAGYAQQVAADHPRPKVGNSSKLGNVITLNVSYDDPAAGFYGGPSGGTAAGSITGIRLYQACGTDPGRAASSWTHVTTVPYDGGSESHVVSVDCSTGLVNGAGSACPFDEVLLAAGLGLIDGVNSSYVSKATIVECDPNLAEPGRPSRPRPGGPAIDRPRKQTIDR